MSSTEDQPCYCVIDVPATPREEWHPADRDYVDLVKEYGWAVTQVFWQPESHYPSDFAYTTGMWHSFRVPELCVFGLNFDDLHPLLNNAAEMFRDGWRPDPGQRTDALLEDLDMRVQSVREEHFGYYFGRTTWFAQAPPLSFLQLVWPDANGVFPDEPGFDDDLQHHQPLLWL